MIGHFSDVRNFEHIFDCTPSFRQTIHIVSYGKGQHQYFDSKDHEYQLEKVNGGDM